MPQTFRFYRDPRPWTLRHQPVSLGAEVALGAEDVTAGPGASRRGAGLEPGACVCRPSVHSGESAHPRLAPAQTYFSFNLHDGLKIEFVGSPFKNAGFTHNCQCLTFFLECVEDPAAPGEHPQTAAVVGNRWPLTLPGAGAHGGRHPPAPGLPPRRPRLAAQGGGVCDASSRSGPGAGGVRNAERDDGSPKAVGRCPPSRGAHWWLSPRRVPWALGLECPARARPRPLRLAWVRAACQGPRRKRWVWFCGVLCSFTGV